MIAPLIDTIHADKLHWSTFWDFWRDCVGNNMCAVPGASKGFAAFSTGHPSFVLLLWRPSQLGSQHLQRHRCALPSRYLILAYPDLMHLQSQHIWGLYLRQRVQDCEDTMLWAIIPSAFTKGPAIMTNGLDSHALVSFCVCDFDLALNIVCKCL